MADDYEDVSVFQLTDERERTLLDTQTECVLMWTTDSGAPVGVVMNFVFRDDRFWFTATRRRKRIASMEARPRIAVAITSRGTDIGVSQSITYQGDAVIHDDRGTADWFYPALAARVRPESADQQAAFVRHLDSPGRVVIEMVPDVRMGFDAEQMFAGSDAGPSRTKV
ncbi:MAG: pyridoxamine 5'-phosphate oxidase family protein [Actinomycetota bacterium]